jgi:hypothetical protein
MEGKSRYRVRAGIAGMPGVKATTRMFGPTAAGINARAVRIISFVELAGAGGIGGTLFWRRNPTVIPASPARTKRMSIMVISISHSPLV